MDTSDYLFLNQEVCFRDEDEDPLPCPEEYQMVKIFSEDHKIKVQSPERLYEWPQYNEALNTTRTKGSGTAVSGGHQVFKPPKRGEKPRITCFDPQTVSIPLFKEACQGAMLGHLQPVRGRRYAMATLYYARNKGVRGICCSSEVIDEGEDPVR
ncbi:hypothetical protein TKK_0005549 [Trichogramma kaykai]